MYSAVISPEIKDFMFSLYNLLELQDYRNLPSRYRYFYLELSKMIYLIKYKVKNNEAPFYVLTVDQLAKKLGVEIAEPKYRKKKIVSILTKMNGYLKYTNFNFSFIKGEHDKWAYTVLFSFPQDTLRYFDEGQYAVVTKRFYKSLLWLYVELAYPEIELESKGKKVKELESDKELYGEFLQWANSSENIEKKNSYISMILWQCSAGSLKGGHQRGSRKFLIRKFLFSKDRWGKKVHNCVKPSTFHVFLLF